MMLDECKHHRRDFCPHLDETHGSPRARSAARSSIVTAIAAAICVGGLSSLALAQGQANQGQDQGAAAQNGEAPANANSQLQEVVVTAERRAENVQTTPIAVTAITGDQLKSNQVNTISDLTKVVPTLSISPIGTYNLINIRGVGDALGETPITSGVAMITDGLVNPLGVGSLAPMFDLADVEVLRGPQGTFIGGNAEGGAIEITTANPTFTGNGGYATVQFGTYHHNLDELAVNLPASDTLAFRLALHVETQNSFYDTKTTLSGVLLTAEPEAEFDPGNTNRKDMRLSMLWKPTDHFQFLFKTQLDTNNTDGLPYNINPNTFAPLPGEPCPPGTGGATGPCHNADYPYYSGNPWVLNQNYPSTPFEYYQRTYTGEARYTFGDGIVYRFFGGSSIYTTPQLSPGCYCSQPDGGQAFALGANAAGNVDDNIEMDLLSPTTGKVQWIVGMSDIYTNQSFDTYSYATGPAPRSGLGSNPASGFPNGSSILPSIGEFPSSTLATRAYGVFGNITWQFTPTLQLQAGLRGNWDNNWNDSLGYDYGWSGNVPYTCPATAGGNAGNGERGSKTSSITVPSMYPCNFPTSKPNVVLNNGGTFVENHQTGKVGLNWAATPDEYFYIFAARAYKPGVVQFHALGVKTPDAQAETLNDYELGWKGTYLQRHMTTQLGAYYSGYDSMQQNLFNVNNPQNAGVANIGHAVIWGLEGNLQYQSRTGFGATLAIAYTHSALSPLQDIATYKEPPGFGTGPGGAAFSLPGCPPGVPTSSTCFQYAPYIVNLKGAETTYAPKLTYNLTLQYGFQVGPATIQPRVQFSHSDQQWSNVLQQDPYYELSQRNILNAYLDYIQGPWNLSLYATNVNNDLYQTVNNTTTVLYGAPRELGAKVTRTF
jgi:iron complex outermembrane recepter protein